MDRRGTGTAGAAAAAAFLAGVAAPALAHEGPPYPIAMDEPLAGLEVSVWTDPDVGTGTFWVLLEPASAVEATTGVRILVRPRDRDGEWTEWTTRRESSRQGAMHYGEIPFPAEEWWKVRILVDHRGATAELAREVEVTPPGQGPVLDFVLYLFPFVAVGALLVATAARRRAAARG